MKWVLIAGVIVCWFILPTVFNAMVDRDADDLRSGIKAGYSRAR